jgi:hypothetical protein
MYGSVRVEQFGRRNKRDVVPEIPGTALELSDKATLLSKSLLLLYISKTTPMQRYIITERTGVNGLRLETDATIPQIKGPNDVGVEFWRFSHLLMEQIRIKIKALSLNARDIQILNDEYPAPHAIPENVVPISGMLTHRASRDLD